MNTSTSSFYVTGGTLRRDAPSYVHRQADTDLYNALMAGQFSYVLTSRQMGKSSLMVRTAVRLRKNGVTVIALDLTAIGQNVTAEQWYQGLLILMGQQLNIEDELEAFWTEHTRFGPLQRWMQAIREVILSLSDRHVVIFIDEIDAIRSLPFSTDEFFAGVREFYNRRAEDAELERLTFCLLGVATPSDLIRDIRTTPFNIGRRIELQDFTKEEAIPLMQGLGRDEKTGTEFLERILYWTGGHPYLTQHLCQVIEEDGKLISAREIDHICEKFFLSSQARERDDNLLFVRERILRSEDADRASLLDLYLQILKHKKVRDDETNPLISVLRLSGIIKAKEGYLKVRNRIYYRVFDQPWLMANMPDAELRRQRVAYRKGLLRAAVVSVFILVIMAGLAGAAIKQAQRAVGEARRAEEQKVRADQNADRAEKALRELQGKRELEAALTDANKQKIIAEESGKIAEEQRYLAEEQKKIAVNKTVEAERQRSAAETQRRAAETQRLVAENERTRANDLLTRANELLEENLRLSYIGSIKSAEEAWNQGNIRRMEESLDNKAPDKFQRGLLSFEWYYLEQLLHSDLLTIELPWVIQDSSIVFTPNVDKLIFTDRDTVKGDTVKEFDLINKRERILWPQGVEESTDSKNEKNYIAFSADGKRIAITNKSTSNSKTIQVLDVASKQKLLDENLFPQVDIRFAAFSPDGNRLAIATSDDTIEAWELDNRQTIFSHNEYDSRGGFVPDNPDSVTYIAFSPDGKLLVTARRNGVVKGWDLANKNKALTLEGHKDFITSVAFSPNGKQLATSSNDRTAKVWDITSGRETFTLAGHNDEVKFVAFSPDGSRLATASKDRTVKIWGASDGQELMYLKGHKDTIVALKFSPDGKQLTTVSKDKTAKVWDIVNEQGSLASKYYGGIFTSVAFSPDGSLLATGNSDNTVMIVDAFNGKEQLILRGHKGPVSSVAFSPDGKRLAAGSKDQTAIIWSAVNGQKLMTLEGHSHTVTSVKFSPDGTRLATGSWDNSAILWDAINGKKLSILKGHTGVVSSVAFSIDGQQLATASSDNTVKIWDVTTGQELTALQENGDFVTSVVFSPDGKRLATASSDGVVKIYYGNKDLTLKGHEGSVSSVAFSPDGKRLATGGLDKRVIVWDVVTGREILTFTAGPIWSIAFSPDSKRLAAGSVGIVKVWGTSGPSPISRGQLKSEFFSLLHR